MEASAVNAAAAAAYFNDNISAASSGDYAELRKVSSAAGERMLRDVHNVVIPPIPCSFSWRNHPDYQQLTKMSDAWLLGNFTNMPAGADHGRPSSSFTAEHMIQSAFHLLATLAYANGISERMPAIVKMMDWFFMVDDILDDPAQMGADVDHSEELVENVLTVFHGTYVHPCANPSRLLRILTDTAAEWWSEMCMDMPPKQKVRLSEAFDDYLDANRLQVSYRNFRQLPNLHTYLKVRAHSSGWRPCAVTIEHCQGFELDDEALSHPLLMKLNELTTEQVILVNDVASFKKEYVQGDFCNVVFVLYFQDLYDPNRDSMSPPPTLQGAVLEVVQMIKDKDAECVRLMSEVKNNEDLIQKEGVAGYLEGLGLWMSGNIYWHLVSGRYGICATTDMHATPPDMLAYHHLQLQTNKEASHIVPCGIIKHTWPYRITT